jgi:hypothetical protein
MKGVNHLREHGHLRTEELSIRFYIAMVAKIRENPEPHISNAKQFIAKWRREHPETPRGCGEDYYLSKWESLCAVTGGETTNY